jgi:hypothetical protein
MSINVNQISNNSSKNVSKESSGKITLLNSYKFKKTGEFKINGTKISVTKGANLEIIVKKINKHQCKSGVRAELIKNKNGLETISLKSKRSYIEINDKKSGIVADLYCNTQIIASNKKHHINYFGKEDVASYRPKELLSEAMKQFLASKNQSPNIVNKIEKILEDEAPAFVPVEEVVEDEAPAFVPVEEVVEDEAPAFVPVEEVVEAEVPAFVPVEEVVEDEAPAFVPVEEVVEDEAPAFVPVEEAEEAVEAEPPVPMSSEELDILEAIKKYNDNIANIDLKIKESEKNAEKNFICFEIAKNAIDKTILKHSCSKTSKNYRDELATLIYSTLKTKDFDVNKVLVKKGPQLIRLLSDKVSDLRNFTESALNDKLELSPNKRKTLVQWINELQ